jgi:outer membrane protein
MDAWLERVDVSPQVRAAHHALSAADEEIRKQRAGYEPTVDLVSSYGRNAQQVGNFPGQPPYDVKTGTIGLQLTVPIFTGGGQQARISEAIALRERANQDLVAAQRSSRLAAKQAWFGWRAADSRQPAALQAVRSSQVALRTATQGIASGVRTEADRLQAILQLENARRDFHKARYDLIASFVRLRAIAGKLVDDDMLWLEFMFVEQEPDLQELLPG